MKVNRTVVSLFLLVLLGVGCAGTLFFGGFVNRLLRLRGVSGSAADYQHLTKIPELRRWVDRIPAEANSIRYFAQPHGVCFSADFELSEAEFLEWAANRNWRIIAIQPSIPQRVPTAQGDGSTQYVAVREGYCIVREAGEGESASQGGAAVDAAYDRARGRAYYFELSSD